MSPVPAALLFYIPFARFISLFLTWQLSMFDPAIWVSCLYGSVCLSLTPVCFHMIIRALTWICYTPAAAKAEQGGIFILLLESFNMRTSVAITSHAVCNYFYLHTSFFPSRLLKILLTFAGLQLNTALTFRMSFPLFSFLTVKAEYRPPTYMCFCIHLYSIISCLLRQTWFLCNSIQRKGP